MLMMWSDWGWSLGEFFILAEVLNIEFFFALSGRESSCLVHLVYTDFTHSSIHTNQRFVIQGCPTLISRRKQKEHLKKKKTVPSRTKMIT